MWIDKDGNLIVVLTDGREINAGKIPESSSGEEEDPGESGEYILSLISFAAEAGETAGGGTYQTGEQVTLTATPYLGYEFSGWYDDSGRLLSKEAAWTFTMPAKNVRYTAEFAVREEMSDFVFVSDETTCIIAEVKMPTLVKELVIPEYVTDIAGGAFMMCRSVRSLTTPILDRDLGYYFGDNTAPVSLGKIVFTGDALPEEAFSGFNGLKQVVLSGNVTRIEDYAFNGCTSLESIEIPDSVTSIGAYAFRACGSLESIIIPNSVTSIGEYAFFNCNNLTIFCEAASQPGGWNRFWNNYYYNRPCPVVWGFEWTGVEVTYNFVSNGGTDIESIVSATPVSLPVPEKDGYFFGGWYLNPDCSGNAVSSPYYNAEGATLYAKWVDISEQSEGLAIENGMIVGIGSCTDSELVLCLPIAERAFDGGASITKVTITDGVTSIGEYAFSGCYSLENVIISDGVISIGYAAFRDCSSLTEVVFLSAVPPEIGGDVFGGAWDSEEFTVYVPQGSLETYEAVDDQYWQAYLVEAGKIQETAG